jgi:hypothetical protein
MSSEELIAHAERLEREVEACRQTSAVETIRGLHVLVCPPTSSAARARVIEEHIAGGTAIAILVVPDDRGPGVTLLRWLGHPQVDFSRVAGDLGVAFAHPGGSVAKTHDDYDWRDIVWDAIAPAPGGQDA